MKNGWNSYGKYGKYAEAIAEFKKGISVDSTVPGLWYNLGGAYFSIKEYKEAIAAWQVCLKLKPDYNDARMGMQTSIAILNSAVPQTNKGSQKNTSPARKMIVQPSKRKTASSSRRRAISPLKMSAMDLAANAQRKISVAPPAAVSSHSNLQPLREPLTSSWSTCAPGKQGPPRALRSS